MAKEIERVGIPVAMISAIVPLPQAVGASRIIAGRAIPHPLGDPTLPHDEEIALRRNIVVRALASLAAQVETQLVVPL